MPLSPGTRLGPYEVTAQIGVGGMGEVYGATDTNLKRPVAIKVLPEALAGDAERLVRFQREAEVLARLNHPNIAHIYGLERSDGTTALVMELVEGSTLADRVAQGPISVDDALPIARQIAEALEAAHEQGIIHRDLKPANIKLRPDGMVKVLDFGLAKALEAQRAISPGMSQSPTITTPVQTLQGVILGTAAYMSPEQARGRPLDRRTDIWAFGCVLFEMLTGRRVFEREDVPLTLAEVMKSEPNWTALPPLPPLVETFLRQCLKKDPRQRLGDIHDMRLALEGAFDAALPLVARSGAVGYLSWRWTLPFLVGLIAAGSFIGLASWLLWPTVGVFSSDGAPRHELRQLTFEAGNAETPALSPDGRLLAYATDRAGEGRFDIWLKQLAGGEPIRLTAGPASETDPHFSPDGTKVYYRSAGSIWEVPALGGSPRRLITGGDFSVSSSGDIGFVSRGTGGLWGPITIVPAGGGAPERWRPDCRSVTPPVWSPDGDQIIFAGFCGGDTPLSVGRVSLLLAPRNGGSPQEIATWDMPALRPRLTWFRLEDGTEGLVLPIRVGDATNLYRMSLDGRMSPLTRGTGLEKSPAVTPTGQLVFVRAEQTPVILSLGLAGGGVTPAVEAAPGQLFDLSRDGETMVYKRMLGLDRGQLVLRNRGKGTEAVIAEHRVPFGGVGSLWPQMSPDGTRVVYRLFPQGHYLVSAGGGVPRFLIASADFNLASDWSRDDMRVIGECSPTADGICELDLQSHQVRGLLKDPRGGELLYPSFSWDGRWVTFMRRRTGRTIICVTPVASDGSLGGEAAWVEISSEAVNATRPRFSVDGSAIYYYVLQGSVQVLVKQDIDPVDKHPIGGLERLATVRQPDDLSVIPTVAVTSDRIFFNTVDMHSNIWMTQIE